MIRMYKAKGVNRMIDRMWVHESRKTLVCVDSYHKGVLEGRFFSSWQEADSFDSLSQFLNKMEAMLDELQMPQSYTEKRTFTDLTDPLESRAPPSRIPRGEKATFELQVIFRQHTSWQGVVVWLEQKWEQSFRSVLELVLLMDSALRTAEGSGSL